MDMFEQRLGYRSDFPNLLLLAQTARKHLPEDALLQLAQDTFDAILAESLRSGGWHWKLDVRETVEEIAAMLRFGDQEGYEHLRTALLHYYAERYRKPEAQEYLTYLRAKKKEADLPRFFIQQQKMLSDLLIYARVRSWAEGIGASDLVGVARSMHYNPFATYLDAMGPYRAHHVTEDVVVAVVLGGHCEYRCSTPLWVRMVLQKLDKRDGDERITGAEFVAYLVQVESWIALIQSGKNGTDGRIDYRKISCPQ